MIEIFAEENNHKGSVLIIALLILALSTITGVVVAKMSMNEIRASSNIAKQKMAFYAAESARNFVAKRSDLYGPNNMDPSSPVHFESPSGSLSSHQTFDGYVQYIGVGRVPRGSGFEVGSFKVYKYKMRCNGYGPSGAESHVEAGFYRVGY